MTRWTEGLTRLPLAEAGDVLSDEQRVSLVDELTHALMVDVPVLKGLRASELTTAQSVTENRLWLVFQLAEASQPALNFDREEGRREFLRELRMAHDQLETVEWRIREAMGDGRAPGDEVPDSADDSSTRAIRQRIRRHAKNGQLLLPGVPIGRHIEIGPVPVSLPRGPRLRISAQIAWMTRTRVKVQRIVVAPPDVPRAQAIPGLFACDELARDMNGGHMAYGEILRRAMDTEERLDFDVMVVLDWASGVALRFQMQN